MGHRTHRILAAITEEDPSRYTNIPLCLFASEDISAKVAMSSKNHLKMGSFLVGRTCFTFRGGNPQIPAKIFTSGSLPNMWHRFVEFCGVTDLRSRRSWAVIGLNITYLCDTRSSTYCTCNFVFKCMFRIIIGHYSTAVPWLTF